MDEALLRMLLELQISAVGRSVLFDVARDLQNLASASSAFNSAQLLQARAAQAASEAMIAEIATTRDLAHERQVALDVASAHVTRSVEIEAQIAASTTASAGQQEVAIANVEAALLREQQARTALGLAAIDTDAMLIEVDVARANAAKAAAAVEAENAVGVQRAGSAMVTVGLGMIAVSAVLAGGFVDVAAQAAAFDQQIITIANNTGMAASSVQLMHDIVLQLGSESGAAFDQLAQGFRQANDLSANAKVAAIELNVAQRDAVATGADVSTVTRALAQVMHLYGEDVSTAADETLRLRQVEDNAANTMAVMQTAANLANLTLEQFTRNGAQVFSWAASMGVPLEQASAAFAALSKDTSTAARAGTQTIDMLSRIINPSKEATAELVRLSEISGVKLVEDFNSTSLAAKGLTGIFADLKTAFAAMGYTQAQADAEILKIIPNIRGGAGAFQLLGVAAQDYANVLIAVDDKQANIARSNAAYVAATQSLAGQWRIFTQSVHASTIELGEGFTPSVTHALQVIAPMVERTAQWAVANRDMLSTVVPMAAGITAAAGAVIILSGAVTLLTAALSPELLILGVLVAATVAYKDKEDQLLVSLERHIGILGLIAVASGKFQHAVAGAATGVQQLDVAFKGQRDAANEWGKAIGDGGRLIPQLSDAEDKASISTEVFANHLLGLSQYELLVSQQTGDLTSQIQQMTSAEQEAVSALFGSSKMLVQSWVDQSSAVQGVNSGLAAAEAHLNAVTEAEAAASSGSSGLSAELRGLERRSSELTAQISAANKALRDLANPNLPGMDATNEKIFRMQQHLKQLEDQKLRLEIGGVSATSPAIKAIDTLISRQQEMIQLTQNQESLKYDGELRKIQQAVDGTKQVMTFDQVMSQIRDVKAHLVDWTAQEDELKKQIQATQDTIAASSDGRSQYSQQAKDAREAVQQWKDEQKLLTEFLTQTTTWISIAEPKIRTYGSAASTAASEVDSAMRGLNTDVLMAAAVLPPAQAAVILANDKAIIDALLAKYADLFAHAGATSVNPLANLPPGSLEGPSSRAGSRFPGQRRGFASGGDFVVPGQGGVDSTLVQFFATPGESVSVGGQGSQGKAVVINLNVQSGAFTAKTDGGTDVSDLFAGVMRELDASAEAFFRTQNVRQRSMAGAQ